MSSIASKLPFTHHKPKQATDQGGDAAIGSLASEFESFQQNSKYGWNGRVKPKYDTWKIQEPKHGPAVPRDIPKMFKDILKATWKVAEPSANAQRGGFMVGTRGMDFSSRAAVLGDNYHAQVRPTRSIAHTVMPNEDAVASDWYWINKIDRKNAVSFRGDTRTPQEVIGTAKGFFPRLMQPDRAYLEKQVFAAFHDYMERRFHRDITKKDFMAAVGGCAPSPADQRLLVQYMLWRNMVMREAAHLGRMVENEVLKGYTSTSYAIDSAIEFGSGRQTKAGWIYLVIVHNGFVVPFDAANVVKWGSGEAEIAQWGPIPAERIVGFAHVDWAAGIGYHPDGPIYMRRSFRKHEPKAFEKMFNIISGALPKSA